MSALCGRDQPKATGQEEMRRLVWRPLQADHFLGPFFPNKCVTMRNRVVRPSPEGGGSQSQPGVRAAQPTACHRRLIHSGLGFLSRQAAAALSALSSTLLRQRIPDQSSWSSDTGAEGFLVHLRSHCRRSLRAHGAPRVAARQAPSSAERSWGCAGHRQHSC